MPDFKIKVFSLVLNSLVYLAMLAMGLYFIYQGGVVQRFILKRSNFATYEDQITELPTIVIWVYPKNASFGEDFKLYFSTRAGSDNEIEVAFGKNSQKITDSELKFDFKRYYQGLSALNQYPNLFKITPNVTILPSTIVEWRDSVGFSLRLSFTNPNIMNGKEFGLALSTENNTASCQGRHYDGDVDWVREKWAKSYINKLTYFTRKYSYLPFTNRCRNRPYTEILIENMNKNINKRCTLPCKPDESFENCPALRTSKFIDRLPVCQNRSCFDKAFDDTLKLLSVYSGPCTKFQYEMTSKKQEIVKHKDIMQFQIMFWPPRVKTYEEYLVYDMIAMISAIGGTMGLCIGFSFTDFARITLKLIEKAIYHISRNRMDDWIIQPKEHFPKGGHYPSTAGLTRHQPTNGQIES